jgi:hypothetical protein
MDIISAILISILSVAIISNSHSIRNLQKQIDYLTGKRIRQ